MDQPTPTEEPIKKVPSKNSNKILYLIIAILVILLAATIGYALSQKSTNNKTNQETTVKTEDKTKDENKNNTNIIKDVEIEKNKPSVQQTSKIRKVSKEACAKHSKLCFRLPTGWSSEFSSEKDQDWKKNNPNAKGEIYIEKLSLFDDQGKKKINFQNTYPSADYNGAWGVGGACIGTIDRTVVNYKKINLNSTNSKFKNNWVVQAVVDTIDPSKIDGESGSITYEPYLEFAVVNNQANKIGTFPEIDCDTLVLRDLVTGLTQEFDNYTITAMLTDKPLNKQEAIAELNKSENKKAFEVMANIYQK